MWIGIKFGKRMKIIEFRERKVYSDFSLSKSLFLFCASMRTLVHDLKIIVRALTFRTILVSPKGNVIDFFHWIFKSSSSLFC